MHVNSGTQFKTSTSRFNTGKQHVNSGSVHVNTARVNRSPVNRPFSRNTSHKSNKYAVKDKMGTAVKTSAGCVRRKVIPLSNTNSGPTPESTIIVSRGPQGRPKPVKAWDWLVQEQTALGKDFSNPALKNSCCKDKKRRLEVLKIKNNLKNSIYNILRKLKVFKVKIKNVLKELEVHKLGERAIRLSLLAPLSLLILTMGSLQSLDLIFGRRINKRYTDCHAGNPALWE
ncbi:hypothetical protein Tco_1073751 [Tanacetum coccineum]